MMDHDVEVRMTAKEYLRSVRLLNDAASAEIRKLEAYREKATYGTGTKEAERISGTSQRSRVEDNICKAIDLETRLRKECRLMDDANAAVDLYVDRRDEAKALIRKMPQERFREILWRYYIDGLTWGQLSEQMRLSRRFLFRLHGWALLAFDKIYNSNQK